MQIIYAARWVLPIHSRTIEDGAVAIDGANVLAVGTRADVITRFAHAPVTDFGLAAILPGLINAHSHLELTIMRGFLESYESDFFAWLRNLTVARMAMSDEDLVVSATCGAIEAARAGITCIGDSSSSGAQTMQALGNLGLRGIVYQESFGPDPRLAEENVDKLRRQLEAMEIYQNALVRAGVSPHAPYTVSAPQIKLISRLALDQKLPLMMHAAESEAERLFLSAGAGPFADGLKQRGIEWHAPGVSTISYLHHLGMLETSPLLAHCVNVDNQDLELIKESNAAIAHCPKSNAKLGHRRAPLADFIAHDLKLGLGSDSVASNNTCDILEEARVAALFARSSQTQANSGSTSPANLITADQVLFAATLGGARALGIDNRAGSLSEGMQADITVVDLSGIHQQPVGNPADALVFSSSGRDVLLTVVAGNEIYRGGRVQTVDEDEFKERLSQVRKRITAS